MKLGDLRKLAIRRQTRIRFPLANGLECVVNEHGVAQVPALNSIPDFNLERELAELSEVRAILALGNFAYEAVCRVLGVRPRPPFGHETEVPLAAGRTLVCSYHPSQQNTFTGRLTQQMLDSAVRRAVERAFGTEA